MPQRGSDLQSFEVKMGRLQQNVSKKSTIVTQKKLFQIFSSTFPKLVHTLKVLNPKNASKIFPRKKFGA